MGGESADIHCTAKLARRTQRPLEYVHFSTFLSTNLNAPGRFRMIYRDEGWHGLYRGTTLVLVGVSNGALQFMAYVGNGTGKPAGIARTTRTRTRGKPYP